MDQNSSQNSVNQTILETYDHYNVPTVELMRAIHYSAGRLKSYTEIYGTQCLPSNFYLNFGQDNLLDELIERTACYFPNNPNYSYVIQKRLYIDDFIDLIGEWESQNPSTGEYSLYLLTNILFHSDNNNGQSVLERVQNYNAPFDVQLEFYHLYTLFEGHGLLFRSTAVKLLNFINNEYDFINANSNKWGWSAWGTGQSYFRFLDNIRDALTIYFAPYNYSAGVELNFKNAMKNCYSTSLNVETPPLDFIGSNNNRSNFSNIKQLLGTISGATVVYDRYAPYPVYGGVKDQPHFYNPKIDPASTLFTGYRGLLDYDDGTGRPIYPQLIQTLEINFYAETERRTLISEWLSGWERKNNEYSLNPYGLNYASQIQSLVGKETYQFVHNLINNVQLNSGLIRVNSAGSKAILTNNKGENFITYDNGKSFSPILFSQINQSEFSKPVVFAKNQEQLNNYINSSINGSFNPLKNGDIYFMDKGGDLFVKTAGQTNWGWIGKYNETETNSSYKNGRLILTQYLYKLNGSRQVLSNGVALTNGNWNGDRYRESYFFEGKKLANGSYAYYNETGSDRNGTSMIEMWKDNPAYFEALGAYHRYLSNKMVNMTADGLIIAGAILAIAATDGMAAPLATCFTITTGTFAIAAGGAKLILDAQGNFNESSKIPTSPLGGFGRALDEMRKGNDLTYQNIGDIVSAFICLTGDVLETKTGWIQWNSLMKTDKVNTTKDLLIALYNSQGSQNMNQEVLIKNAAYFVEIMDFYQKLIETNGK